MSLWDLMIGFLGDLLGVVDEHRDFLMMAMSDSSPLDEVERENMRTELDRILDDIVELARREGVARGLDPARIAVNTRLTIAMVIGMNSYGSWLLPSRISPAEQPLLIEDMANFILYGGRPASAENQKADHQSPLSD